MEDRHIEERRKQATGELDQGILLERIALALESIAQPAKSTQQSTGPVHSGHKGRAFLTQTKRQFEDRFPNSKLEWKTVNQWITTLYNLASRFTKNTDSPAEEDVLWMYQALSASLQNGFAKELSDMNK